MQRRHRSSASFAHGSPILVASSTRDQPAAAGTISSHVNTTTPSRLSRPPLTSPATTASYASSRSPHFSRQDGSSHMQHTPLAGSHFITSPNSSRKRTRPMSSASISESQMYDAAAAPVISPFTATPSATSPSGWMSVTAAHIPVSPPPMANIDYDLAGGMDTPCIAAAKTYDVLSNSDYMGDRISRDRQSLAVTSGEGNEETLSGNKNGRGKQLADDAEMEDCPDDTAAKAGSGWGGYVLGTLGSVMAGAWAFCTKSPFRGFYAGGGQGFDLAQQSRIPDDDAIDSMWEDEREEPQQASQLTPPCTRSFSFERLPTPIPGQYPEDSPTEDSADPRNQPSSPEKRPLKRRQTEEGNTWTIIHKKENLKINQGWTSRASSPRLSSPARGRPHIRTQSASLSKRTLMVPSPRPRRRVSAASLSGHSTPSTATPLRRPSSSSSSYMQNQDNLYHDTYPSYSISSSFQHDTTPTHHLSNSTNLKTSPDSQQPLSAEARKYVSRRRKQDRLTEQRYDRLNDQLQEMIRQGREALGTTVAVLDDNRDETVDDDTMVFG